MDWLRISRIGPWCLTAAASVGMLTLGCAKSASGPTTTGPAPLATITVSPSPDTVIVFGTQVFTTVGKDAAGNVVAFTPTWSVASGDGTINGAGLFTAGSSPGTSIVRAVSGGISGSAVVVVTAAATPPGTVTSISVSPTPDTLSASATQQFTAVGKDGAGNVVAFTPTWSVANGGGTINSSGLFTAGTVAGTFSSTVKAAGGGISGYATVSICPCMVDLGTTGSGLALNDAGQVVGSTSSGRAFIWEAGSMRDLGVAGAPQAINSAGQVVGYNEQNKHAFFWQNGATTDLGTLGGDGLLSDATWINDAGEAAGVSETSDSVLHAVVWSHGVITDVATLRKLWPVDSGFGGEVAGFNAAGQVLLVYHQRTGTSSYVWQNGAMSEVGSAADEVTGQAINASGQVVGFMHGGGSLAEAFLWQDGALSDLGSGFALAINDRSQVFALVGTGASGIFLWDHGTKTYCTSCGGGISTNNSGHVIGGLAQPHDGGEGAYFWDQHTMTDLGSLGAGWTYAQALNSNDWIAGSSRTASGVPEAVVWIPHRAVVPEAGRARSSR